MHCYTLYETRSLQTLEMTKTTILATMRLISMPKTFPKESIIITDLYINLYFFMIYICTSMGYRIKLTLHSSYSQNLYKRKCSEQPVIKQKCTNLSFMHPCHCHYSGSFLNTIPLYIGSMLNQTAFLRVILIDWRL